MSDHIDRAAEIARRERTVLETCEAHRITPGPSSAWTLLTALVSVLNDMPAHDAAVAAKAWDEGWQDACCLHGGYASCGKPDAHNHGAANPYREREGGSDV